MVGEPTQSDIERIKHIYEEDRHRDYHEGQFGTLYRSTVHLLDFVKKCITDPDAPYRIIDVGCGGGANIYYLSDILPGSTWVGLDWAEKFFKIGHKYLSSKHLDYQLVKGDFFKLEETFGKDSFDIVFSIQTLSWLPTYEQALEQLISVARNWVFVTSLFSDFNVDIINNVYQYPDEEWDVKADHYNYSIYSIKKFEHFCEKLGASEVFHEDFFIDIDLPRPDNKLMGTYTLKNESGTRMQFSGPLYMPWKAVAIKK